MLKISEEFILWETASEKASELFDEIIILGEIALYRL